MPVRCEVGTSEEKQIPCVFETQRFSGLITVTYFNADPLIIGVFDLCFQCTEDPLFNDESVASSKPADSRR
jgi:hypothetical protein